MSERARSAFLACIAAGTLVGGSVAIATATARSEAASLPQGSEPVALVPGDFSTKIDNPYWPMAPGSRWTYTETDENGEVSNVNVTVTKSTRVVAGIKTRVIHDVHTDAEGGLLEDTYDWYAQDRAGNVWYFGEDTKEYENGRVVSTAGSWEAGVGGAHAGVAMPARPRAGLTYRQEYSAGVAEDAATVLSVGEQVQVPFGHFTDVLLTKDYTPLDPAILEYKLYAPGVGPVSMLGISPAASREELVRFRDGADDD